MVFTLKHIVPEPLSGTFSFHEIWGNELNFESPHFYLIKAASGKGKSTLLHILYGLRKDFKGDLLIDHKMASLFSDSEWAGLRRNKIAMLFQDLKLFANLTVAENIRIKSDLNPEFSDLHLKNIAEELEIDVLFSRKCGTLSLGQQQRVALLRTLTQNFEFLFLDEPFSHLDKGNSDKICKILMRECERRDAGIIMSSLGDEYPLPFFKTLTI